MTKSLLHNASLSLLALAITALTACASDPPPIIHPSILPTTESISTTQPLSTTQSHPTTQTQPWHAAPSTRAAAQSVTSPVTWDTYADTWVATDDLGRTLPTNTDVGAPHPNRHVGIFYFLWLPGDVNSHYGPYDMSKIMAQDPDALSKPDSPLWGPRNTLHYWGQPLFGYYRIIDPYVLRKHAVMLADAGVDTVLFDTTNSYNYFSQVSALADVWLELQAKGQAVPHFVFTCRAGEGDKQAQQVDAIYKTIYQNPKYASLWYVWKGKPLIIASPDTARLTPDELAFFTFRSLHWPNQPEIKPYWYLTNSIPYSDGNDRFGIDDNGNLEEMAATVATSYLGGPMSTNTPLASRAWRGRKADGHLDTSPDAVAQGGQFQDEWDFVHAHDPSFVLVYCWNEWVAQRLYDKNRGYYFVDTFSESHSKDIEPMTGGHGDDYYYQMIANIRKYKGVRPLQPVTPTPITIDGNFNDWTPASPEYHDTLGDTSHRSFDAFGSLQPPYQNTTGRNDLASAKVSYDKDNVYFLVSTTQPLIHPASDADANDWMTLYVDSDNNPKTGWLGYDLRISPYKKIVKKNTDGKYNWSAPTTIPVAIGPTDIELSIPRSLFPAPTNASTNAPTIFNFKWTDNCYQFGDWRDFTLNGDAAPNDRFNFRAILK